MSSRLFFYIFSTESMVGNSDSSIIRLFNRIPNVYSTTLLILNGSIVLLYFGQRANMVLNQYYTCSLKYGLLS